MKNSIPIWLKLSLFTLGFLVLIDLLYLNYRILTTQQLVAQSVLPSPLPSVETQTETVVSDANQRVDPVWLLGILKEATASLTQKVDMLINNPSTVNKQTIIPQPTNKVKEYYIPLGTGSTVNSDWTNVTGAEAYVAPTNYGSIKEMYFEASLRIPTGNGQVYARLINVTDGVSLFESEVHQDGTTSGLVSSGKVPIPNGTKLFRVQLKSTLGSQVLLESSRIKIFVN